MLINSNIRYVNLSFSANETGSCDTLPLFAKKFTLSNQKITTKDIMNKKYVLL